MARHAKSECTLPSTLTAYGGSGCCSMATSSDGLVVAAATDEYLNIYPVCSIWMPCLSIPIPTEISSFNKKLHSRICRHPDCLYKLEYPAYVKPDLEASRKPTRKKNMYNGTIQLLMFHGEKNEYLVGAGPFLFVIYDLRTMNMKPLVCLDMRYFGVDAVSYPYQLQASLETLNIRRNFMYYNRTLSCVDFIFSVKPFVPTYFRVLFDEKRNWWVVDCNSTTAIIFKEWLDEEVPYVFYNHDRLNTPEMDGELNELELFKDGDPFEYVGEQKDLEDDNNMNEEDKMEDKKDENNQNRNQKEDNMDLDGSETRLSGVYDNRNGMDVEDALNNTHNTHNEHNMDKENNDDMEESDETAPSNYDSENESDVDNENKYSTSVSTNTCTNTNGTSTSFKTASFNVNSSTTSTNNSYTTKDETKEYDTNPTTTGQSQILSKAIDKGVYHPFCILEKKLDFQGSKIDKLAKKLKEGELSYTQQFLLATFVPIGTVVMIKFSVDNKFHIGGGKVRHSELCKTSCNLLADLVISHLVSKVHTFSARRHGRVFTLMMNEKFYVLKYTAPTVVSTSLMVDGDENTDDNRISLDELDLDLLTSSRLESDSASESSGDDSDATRSNSESMCDDTRSNSSGNDGDVEMIDLTIDETNVEEPSSEVKSSNTSSKDNDVVVLDDESEVGSNEENKENTSKVQEADNEDTPENKVNLEDMGNAHDTHNEHNMDKENNDDMECMDNMVKVETDNNQSSFVNLFGVYRNYKIRCDEDDEESSIYLHFSHYDPVLKLHYTIACFDLSKSDGYVAICTNYTSQWGLQIFSLSSQTGIDGLRLVLDSSKCKGFSHISWLPYSKKLLAISRMNGELFQLEPKAQRNWVGLISNFTCIDKNVEYIETEDAFDLGPDGEMTSPIAVHQGLKQSNNDPTKDEKYKGLGWKRDCYRYPFFEAGFSVIGHFAFELKSRIKASDNTPLFHVEDQDVKEKYKRLLNSTKLK